MGESCKSSPSSHSSLSNSTSHLGFAAFLVHLAGGDMTEICPPEARMLALGAQMEAAVRVSLGVSHGARCLQPVSARWLRWHLQPVSG
jgi:hypothetical protein